METSGHRPVREKADAAIKAGAEAVRIVFASVHGHAQAQIVTRRQLHPIPKLVIR